MDEKIKDVVILCEGNSYLQKAVIQRAIELGYEDTYNFLNKQSKMLPNIFLGRDGNYQDNDIKTYYIIDEGVMDKNNIIIGDLDILFKCKDYKYIKPKKKIVNIGGYNITVYNDMSGVRIGSLPFTKEMIKDIAELFFNVTEKK